MKGRPNRRLYVIVLALPLWQTCGFSIEQICSNWPETGYIGDSRDCQSWGYCQNHKLLGRGRCPDGRFYDAPTGTCQKSHLARCAAQQWELCAHRQTGEYVADSLDCRKYTKCVDEAAAQVEVNYCPKGYAFSNRLQTCVSRPGECSENSLIMCAFMQSGSILGDPLNCGLYLECQNGVGTRRACTADRYYNHKTGRCQTTRPKHCPVSEDVYQPVKYPPPAFDLAVCASFYQAGQPGVQLFSDALTCYGYYACSSQYAIGRWHSCPQDTHFQWWSQRCVPPDAYSCPYDRCGNVKSSFVAAINTGCSEYIYCKDQAAQQLIRCPEEYPYFEERRGVCSEDFPNYTVCYMDG